MVNKFCLGVVLYNPTAEELRRLNTYTQSGFFKEVLVYDNSVSTHQGQVPASVKYTFYNHNNGLSIPYNQMIEYCTQQQYDYLCILDQDSNYPLEEMKKLIDFINEHPQDLVNTAIIAPRYYKPLEKQHSRQQKLSTVKWTINSGSFLNVKLLQRKGLSYDEKVFLDALDFDFCWSVREKDCLVQIYEDSVFVQNLGQLVKGRSFCSHSSSRYYNIVHNKKHIHRKRLGYVLGTAIAIIKTGSTISKVLLYEENKWPKLKSCLKGLIK